MVLRIRKEDYKKMTDLIDVRPIKKALQENEPERGFLRRLLYLEEDFVMSCEWDYLSRVYEALAIVEGPDRLKEIEEEQKERSSGGLDSKKP